ncbi:MAG: SPOR domain-containing protein [bacterium]
MRVRSILMGLMVVLMGMAAGLLLSLLFWPSPSKPPEVPQGLVSKRLPVQEPPAPETSLNTVVQSIEKESTKVEPAEQVGSSEAALAAPEEKRIQNEQPPTLASDSVPEEQPKESADTVPQKQRPVSGQARPKPAKGSPHKGYFTLHVGSFKSAEAAARRVSFLRQQGLDAFSRQVEIAGKGLFHRVLVGKFQDRASAKGFLEQLKAEKKIEEGRVLSSSDMGG